MSKHFSLSELSKCEVYLSIEDREDQARYMGLDTYPLSDDAYRLVDALCDAISPFLRGKASRTVRSAVAAFLGDLMAAAEHDRCRRSYREFGMSAFAEEYVGYRPARNARDALLVGEWIGMGRGWSNGFGYGLASRFWARDKLFDLAESHGVTPAEWRRHFARYPRRAMVREPVILRAGKNGFGGECQGRKMKFDASLPEPAAAIERVHRLNAYFANVDIDGADHRGFRRIYGQGDQEGVAWNRGGRLYSIGGGYQALRRIWRPAIRIRQEPTVELDIKSSHLTIVRALLGFPLGEGDLYEVANVPRIVAKLWVTMTLGYGKYHNRWSNGAAKHYAKETGRNLKQDYPFETVKPALVTHFHDVKAAIESGIGWGQLQYLESCAIIDAVEQLAYDHDVPALPVHDSLIVPASKHSLADTVLSACFKRHIGVRPTLELK